MKIKSGTNDLHAALLESFKRIDRNRWMKTYINFENKWRSNPEKLQCKKVAIIGACWSSNFWVLWEINVECTKKSLVGAYKRQIIRLTLELFNALYETLEQVELCYKNSTSYGKDLFSTYSDISADLKSEMLLIKLQMLTPVKSRNAVTAHWSAAPKTCKNGPWRKVALSCWVELERIQPDGMKSVSPGPRTISQTVELGRAASLFSSQSRRFFSLGGSRWKVWKIVSHTR
jgi:hypothetical protein